MKHRKFDATVDHVTVTQILKAKTEPASNRMMRLLDHLSAYSFEPVLPEGERYDTDYLSRHCNEDEDSTDLIPDSFCRLRDVHTLCIGTRASIKASGEEVPQIHGAHKTLDPPSKKPEQQHFVRGKTPKKSMPTPQWCVHKKKPTAMLEEPLERQSSLKKTPLYNTFQILALE